MNLLVYGNLLSYKKSRVLVKNDYIGQQLRDRGVRDVTVAPVGLDLSIIPNIREDKLTIKNKYGIPKDKKIIMCVSRLEISKQPLDLFKLIPLLKDEYFIIFIGTGQLKNEFLKTKNKNDLNDKFCYIESISNTEIHKFYKISDYFVNFNENEIFGMAILEAMYQGSTVIAKSAPGPNCTINNGTSGFIVNSIEEMAYTINSNKKINSIDAYRHVINNFTWDGVAQSISNYYLKGVEK